ncbi:MAG: hypothetical protein H6699_01025 [Myxococcales bacterium]|nr:hypothetical protein [Myxococcales bacterium]
MAGGLLWASYRKDYSLPRSTYPEYTDIPDDGGRFHIVGVAATSGAVTGAFVDDVALSDAVLPPSPSMEWYHVWPDPVVEGAPVWVAFHSRRADWDERASARVRLETAGGIATRRRGRLRPRGGARDLGTLSDAARRDARVCAKHVDAARCRSRATWPDGRDASEAGAV